MVIDPTSWLLPFTHIFLGLASFLFKIFTAAGPFGAMAASLVVTVWFGMSMGKVPKGL
jgi:hypothetical protein